MSNIKEKLKVGMILNIKEGLSRGGDSRKILAICDSIYGMSCNDDFDLFFRFFSLKELQQEFILPEEKWVPEHGSTFFYVSSELKVCTEKCEVPRINFPVFSGRLIAVGNCFPTEALAEKKAEEIRNILAK